MTDEQHILSLLQDGQSITQKQASAWFDCTRLGARICDLRKAGYQIETTMRKNRKKRGLHAEYRMVGE